MESDSRHFQLLILHIGAHKTATTHLQATLKANRESLAEEGFLFLPIKEIRTQFTEKMVTHRYPWTQLMGKKYFNEIFLNYRGAIFSDENILGRLHESGGPVFYPKAEGNLRAVLAMGGSGRKTTILLSIRNYANWVESVYTQILKTRVLSFSEFLAEFPLEAISWPDLIYRLKALSPENRIVIWPYELYYETPEVIFGAIEDLIGVRIPTRVQGTVNASYSKLGIDLLLKLHPHLNKEGLRILHMEIKKNLSTLHLPRARFLNESQRLMLDERYQLDLIKLQSLKDPLLTWIGGDLVPVSTHSCEIET